MSRASVLALLAAGGVGAYLLATHLVPSPPAEPPTPPSTTDDFGHGSTPMLDDTATADDLKALLRHPPPTTPAHAADATEGPEPYDELADFTDTKIPLATRLDRIAGLGTAGDARSAPVLMALGDSQSYVRLAAVKALGNVDQPAVGKYLREKLSHADPVVVAAAATGLARLEGDAAIDSITATLVKNRRRADGYEEDVCTACVQALASTRSPRACAVLHQELVQTVGQTLLHEYGSAIVAALRQLGEPASRGPLQAYAVRLETERERMADNPMGVRYVEDKIAEVAAALNALRGDAE